METETSEASLDGYSDSTLFRGNICGPVAASMNESMFQLVISKWRTVSDGLKETHNYKFLSAAGSLMKIMVIYTSSLTCFFEILVLPFLFIVLQDTHDVRKPPSYPCAFTGNIDG